MGQKYETFLRYRQRMNERILGTENRVIKRVFSVDTLAYQPGGALSVETRELLGLVASLVLRCDDCVSYHLARCREVGLTETEIVEAMSVGLVVGGTIVIPHLRRAMDFLDDLESEATPGSA